MNSIASSPIKRYDAQTFIERVCGLKLRKFQREWLKELFREEDGERIYSQALLGLPRGNGKTELAAAVALKMLCADGAPQPQVVLAAGSDKQAAEAFDAAKSMYDASPALQRRLHILRGRKVLFWRNDDNAWLRTVSAEAPLAHGMKPTAVVFDEVWNQKKRELWEALTGGLVKRPEPLLICISSAGYDEDSLLGEEFRRGQSGEDPRFYFKWYSAPPELPYENPKTWRIANPALADEEPFLHESGLEDNLRRMHENEFRRWHLGQWTPSEDTFLTADLLEKCDGKPKLKEGVPTVLGVDASISRDATVVATVQRHPDGIYHAEFRVWEPTRKHSVPLEEVEQHIRSQADTYDVVGVVYDKQFFGRSAQVLEDERIAMAEWPQNNAHMCPATHTLYEVISGGRLRYGGHPIVRHHLLAAAVQETERGLRIKKTASRAPDDAAVALAMAVEYATRKTEKRRSRYSDPNARLAVA